ncbi:hypothetical protein IU421_29975 [Nocardia cyriacigeorgica]|uniref:relaxase/mobilization nuclease domain-containing protein n=1 Tax=Nocardia cyriacigeorgica TaxID=135487 RepID=UPI001895C6F0|nr:hypothetical protein [Nocardia cyriacigeorgica]MBF6518474.1 hypothetical protein [Nocardia cyriacigeorgica]
MIPNIKKGSYIGQLLVYLAGPGRANEHRDQQVIAGDVVVEAVYMGPITTRQAAELAKLIDSPRQTVLRGAPVLVCDRRKAQALMDQGMDRAAAFEAATSDQNTWHCSLTLAPDEPALSKKKWRAIAHDFMKLMGYAHRDDGVPDARWGTVHHGPNKGGGDHIHIAMGIVRPDGSTCDTFRDFPRAQQACNVLEHKYGLRVLASREEGGAERATKPAERARAERVGAPETDREAMQRRVRALAVACGSEAEWIREMRAAGITPRPYFAKGSTEEVTGYSVQMRPQRNADGKLETALTFSGLRLGRDMTLPALRSWASWDRSVEAQQEALAEWQKSLAASGQAASRGGRSRIVSPMDQQQAIDQLGRWSDYVRTIPSTDRDAWSKAASQSAGLFEALSVNTEERPGPIHEFARQLGKAGHQPAHERRSWGVHGSGLRDLSRFMWATRSPIPSNTQLMYALMDLLIAIQQMCQATNRARMAAAMAAEARRSLSEIHMRQAGIDVSRPFVRDAGSPAWAAERRAAVILDRGDLARAEDEIQVAGQAWKAKRAAAAGRASAQQVDEFGHIVSVARPRFNADVARRAAGPLTPGQESTRNPSRSDQHPPRTRPRPDVWQYPPTPPPPERGGGLER